MSTTFHDLNPFGCVYFNFFDELSVRLDVVATVFLQTKSACSWNFPSEEEEKELLGFRRRTKH